ncbi:MAG: oligopeptide/dipeptide ABC transporter ATP-binding protein [Spirochaetes bacterium]|nr:MAG: oligopeptide/dipeptide ABC transporter ATP-binding protein [Spirochaetota bacterium]
MEAKSSVKAPLLAVENLGVCFTHGAMQAHALRGIDLEFFKEEIHGLVGESGSGKTVTSTCIMGLLQSPPGEITSGKIVYDGVDMVPLPEPEKRLYRGRKIAMVFQEPGKYLNPAFKIGDQITEMLILHLGLDKKAARERAVHLLDLVGLGKDGRVLDSYPHELSGGMKQRAMIAIAISCDPGFLIADEPTTALDVTLQLQILRLIKKLKDILGMAVLFISHDLGVVKEVADRVSVIYAGRIVETSTKGKLFENPLHPYTKLLMLSIPSAQRRGVRLATIPGRVPDADKTPEGCAFHPRCPLAIERCSRENPSLGDFEEGHRVACHRAGESWIN